MWHRNLVTFSGKVVLSVGFVLSCRAILRMYLFGTANGLLLTADVCGKERCLYNLCGQTLCSPEGPFQEGVKNQDLPGGLTVKVPHGSHAVQALPLGTPGGGVDMGG